MTHSHNNAEKSDEADMRSTAVLMIFLSLSACGPRVTGEIARACVDSDRNAATTQRCSCVQNVAVRELSRSDQSRLVSFFEDPELANDIKINDSRSADAFWDRYRAFTDKARAQCG